jgi:hypothetical protein
VSGFHKFLDAGGVCPLTDKKWPLPEGDAPGAWIERAGPFDPIGLGFTVCRNQDLAYWVGPELYRVEAAGAMRENKHAVIANRVRLLGPCPEWSELLSELAQRCAERIRALPAVDPKTDEYRGDMEQVLQWKMFAGALHIAAIARAHLADPRDDDPRARRAAYLEERGWQSAWIAARLA